MKQSYGWIGFLLLYLLVGSGCGVSNRIPDKKKLYEGSELHYVPSNTPFKHDLGVALSKYLKPKPNKKTFGQQPKLWIYYHTKEPRKNKSLRRWWKYKVGEAPVYMDEVNNEQIRQKISDQLFNMGFFSNQVSTRIIDSDNGRRTKVRYDIVLRTRYQIDTVSYLSDYSPLRFEIDSLTANSILHKGEYFSLDVIKQERERLANELRNKGYFFFSEDYLYYKVDTNFKSSEAQLTLGVKKDIPSKYLKPYTLGKVIVNTNYQLKANKSEEMQNIDTSIHRRIHYLHTSEQFDPEKITELIFLHPGELYQKNKHNKTLKRVMALGTFKYVAIDFKADSTQSGILNATVNLTPTLMKSIRAELKASTKSNNATGPGLTGGYRHRNIFRGGEMLGVSTTLNFETQANTRGINSSSYEITLETELNFPRIIAPFKIKRYENEHTPKTQFKLGVKNISRINLYNLNSLNFNYAYIWKEEAHKTHELNPINVYYLSLTNVSKEFNDFLNNNISLKRSFEQAFILGPSYTFSYDTHKKRLGKRNYVFVGKSEWSGMPFKINTKGSKNATIQESNQTQTIADFLRFELDNRFYLQTGTKSMFAFRLLGGIGITPSNTTLPYSRQFFIGGPNSIRAYLSRSVGPGAFYNPDLSSRLFFEQTGDIKLESSLEYRFPLVSVLRGALFVDAGNIWLLREDRFRPNAKFSPANILPQLAVGVGTGIRLDFTFMILRLDVAFPVKKPYNSKQIPRLRNSAFDTNDAVKNYVFNIAIGYPF